MPSNTNYAKNTRGRPKKQVQTTSNDEIVSTTSYNNMNNFNWNNYNNKKANYSKNYQGPVVKKRQKTG